MTHVTDTPAHAGRPLWRSVAIPSEHGGWGLTGEPVLLGLLVAPSAGGLAIGMVAYLAFLVRTPLKLALVDQRRGRDLARTRLARRVVVVEGVAIGLLGAGAVSSAGWHWLIPLGLAMPLFAIELWFDIRSRSRRLVPELCGAIGIAAVASAVVVAGGGAIAIAGGAWLVLSGRGLASIPFVRTQIVRLHDGAAEVRRTDGFQLLGAATAACAVAVEPAWWAGAVAVAIVAVLQFRWLRVATVPAAKILGVRQLGLGLGVVLLGAAGVVLAR